MSFADMARIPEKEMPQRVTSELDAVLAAPKPLAQSVQHESNFWSELRAEIASSSFLL
jgi:hypothetical protein